MNLFETLQKFKSVKPDPAYTEKSKRAILATRQFVPALNLFRSILQFIETGAAVALAGFFVLLISGALSNSTYIAPVQYSVIDATGLHAEAQAIDMQIKLADVNYQDVTSNNGSTAAAPTSAANPAQVSAAMNAAAPASAQNGTAPETASTTGSPTSTASTIDGALRALEQ